ncbi:hypothetical protein [Polyangium sp. 6x1]|uniref:hypothetical protein n=1 Tax=Polyangium sp. 6x1 TaxID=3042689 RepID=UPI002482B995|nr:hypothetical protein [Polyangium sp. 6x1]MDI1447713.1 hypothetical protein [Polyangium sp. 6x1]
MRAWLASFFLLAPTLVLASSCALEGFEKYTPPLEPVETCGHAAVPGPPAPTPPNDAEPEVEFVVALRVLRLKTDRDGGDLGLDLDRFCSCQGEERSCIPPAGQPEKLSCDKAMGRDNQMPALFGLVELALQVQDLSERYSLFAELGNWGLIFHVSDYNGQPNDSKVRVAWYGSEGTAAQPAWDGNDAWPLSTSTIENGLPKYFDNDAYVTDGMLVVSAPTGGIAIAGGNTRLHINLSSGTIQAKITKDELDRWVLRDGLIAGRIPQLELFRMVQSFRDDTGKPFCTDNIFWGATQDAFCRGLDVQTGPPEPNKPCNAVSFAAGFDADPAVLGVPKDPNPDTPGCPAETDPIASFQMFGCPPPPNP